MPSRLKRSRVDGSLGLTLAAHTSLGASPFYLFGTEEQKQKWLVPLASGEMLGAFGLTEPHAGSDAGGTKTVAVREGDEWVINGSQALDDLGPRRRRDRHDRQDRPRSHGQPGH